MWVINNVCVINIPTQRAVKSEYLISMPWYFTLAESRTKHKNVQQKRKWNRSVKRQIIFLYHVVLGKANWQLKRRLYSKFEASSFTSPWQVKVHASMFHLVLKPFEHNVNEPEVIDQNFKHIMMVCKRLSDGLPKESMESRDTSHTHRFTFTSQSHTQAALHPAQQKQLQFSLLSANN